MEQSKQDDNLPRTFPEAVSLDVLISNAWPQSRKTSGATLDATARALERFPFFERVQTVDIPFPAERRAFRKLVRDSGRPHTYTLTRVMAENNLNLSSPQTHERRRACAEIIARFDEALEAGASIVGLVSGPRPEAPGARGEALRGLEDSLAALCAAARATGLKIMIEPLDYEAHKRAALGSTGEAVSICRNLAAAGMQLSLCIDQAHLLLNGENDICAAVEKARPWLEEFHICNAVLDRAHPLFGDRHPPLGAPGAVTEGTLAKLFRNFAVAGFVGGRTKPAIACEVMTPGGEDPLSHIAAYLQTLERAWQSARRPLV